MADGVEDGRCGGDKHVLAETLGAERPLGVRYLNRMVSISGTSPMVGMR
jgi:hypothetical protein